MSFCLVYIKRLSFCMVYTLSYRLSFSGSFWSPEKTGRQGKQVKKHQCKHNRSNSAPNNSEKESGNQQIQTRVDLARTRPCHEANVSLIKRLVRGGRRAGASDWRLQDLCLLNSSVSCRFAITKYLQMTGDFPELSNAATGHLYLLQEGRKGVS